MPCAQQVRQNPIGARHKFRQLSIKRIRRINIGAFAGTRHQQPTPLWVLARVGVFCQGRVTLIPRLPQRRPFLRLPSLTRFTLPAPLRHPPPAFSPPPRSSFCYAATPRPAPLSPPPIYPSPPACTTACTE